MRRLHGLVPGAYSRLGAAIRHGAAVLEERGGTSRRLLVVLSDGLAYDHGYEAVYGAADARRALAEARRRGHGLPVPERRCQHRCRRRSGASSGAPPTPRCRARALTGDRPAVPLGAPLRGGAATAAPAEGGGRVAARGARGRASERRARGRTTCRSGTRSTSSRRPSGRACRSCSRGPRAAARRASSRRWPTTSSARSSPSPATTT